MPGTVRDNALIGQIVANYRVGPLLGRGGMGAVYEVTHQYLGRRAALKVLHSQFARTPELAARFVNEARAANLVQHPSVVSVFEIGLLADSTPFILMEYLDGQPLSQRIRELATQSDAAAERSALSPATTARIVWSIQLVRQLASALHALHDRGVIHRDLKPDNIVIVKDPEAAGGERAKLLDFGIAKIVGEFAPTGESPFPGVPMQVKTAIGALLGTPVYMGPEQWRGKGNVDHRADIYALGCIFYELLTGRPPYCASAIAQLMQMHVWQKPPSALSEQGAVPRQLAELVQKMLAKEPDERPSTKQVDQELTQILLDLQKPAPPAPQAATMVMRTAEQPSGDDTIPLLRRAAKELLPAPGPRPAATPLRGMVPLPPTEPAQPWPPPREAIARQPEAHAEAEALVHIVGRTETGSAQIVTRSPARKSLRSAVMTGLGTLLVATVAEILLFRLFWPLGNGPTESPPPPIPARQPTIISSPPGATIYKSDGKTRLAEPVCKDTTNLMTEVIVSLPDYRDRHVNLYCDDLRPIEIRLRPLKRANAKPTKSAQKPQPRSNLPPQLQIPKWK